ncbi:MAG: alpha-E domain-containing protein, partial [Pseudomonadota bacterium]|nr:alpha-E domain-containing protein [Pseudomonadota bacterium]
MLSRTAENLYWTARYVERADSIARLLEVAYRIHLIPNTNEGYLSEWDSILRASGIKEEYLRKHKEINKEKIEFFLLFDESNNSSIKSCIVKARNNLKMVRTAVTLEVWNTVNSWYHELENYEQVKYSSKNLPEILDWVKRQVNLIKGTIDHTQLVND